MTMITPSYLGETIEYSSLHACRSTLEDPTSWGSSFTGAQVSSRMLGYLGKIVLALWVFSRRQLSQFA